MKALISLKRIYSALFFYSGIAGAIIRKSSERGNSLVLMYHRVIPPNDLIQAGMYVKPETFEMHLRFLLEKFNILPLKSLICGGEDGSVKKDKPECFLTFDDGWKDFYVFVFPLLVKYQQPATVFLPTGFIASNRLFWADRFASLLSHRKDVCLKTISNSDFLALEEILADASDLFEDKLEAGIRFLKKYPLAGIEKILNELAQAWGVKDDTPERNFLNWEEIREMKESGLVSFGSHTVSHQILPTLHNDDIKRELICSREKLLGDRIVQESCLSFCYPNGNYTREIADMVRECGYHLAVTTKNGWNSREADMYSLKRVGIHQDMSSTISLFACRITGII